VDKDRRRLMMIKLLTIWNANESYEFFPLLANICGTGESHYLLHTFDGGRTTDIEAKVLSRICEVDDDELEARLDALIDD